MAAARPWMKFYPRDWRADEKLRDCSLAARGLWIEMLAIMHASERYGRLLINGTAPSPIRLARQVGTTESEVEALLDELRDAGVFSTDANGTIYSRRMKSDEKLAENARKVGKRGGNPKLLKQTGNSAQDNPQVKPTDKAGDKLRGQSPESREVRTPKPPSLPADVRSVMEEAGFVSPPPDLAMLKDWYAAADEMFGQTPQQTLDQDILPTVRRVRGQLTRPPFKLKVFDAAIREKLAADQREIEHLRKVQRRLTDDPTSKAFDENRAAGAAG
jgi:hypothetical protein